MAQDTTEIEIMNYEPADEILASEDTPMLKAKEINVTGNSFKDIENAISRADDGDTVYLDEITYFGYGSEIKVYKSINLIGKKGTVLDAQKKSRILFIDADDVVLKDITFINGTAVEGGAIYWTSSNAHILNCSFENNTATNNGGANYFDKALTNSIITGNYNHNTATDYGGANNFADTLANTTITGNYNHNTATYYGGANNFMKTLTNTTITGTYNHNTATLEGGANHFTNTLTNSTINGTYNHNTANRGGANHFRNTLTNTTITGIYINNRGSNAVYIQESDQSNIIKDSIFINNTGNNIRVKNGNIQVTDCWFGNTASNYNTDMTNSQGITTDNWYFLDITLNDTDATVILNNLYKNGNTTKDDNCKLPDINITLKGTNIKVPDTQTMKNGNLNIPITPTRSGITLKATYETAYYTKAVGDFELLQNIISSTQENTTIKLNRSYTYTQGLDTITEGIIIDKPLTINGNGHTINANHSTRIFKITSDNVTIKNLTLINGNATGNGGAIYWASNNAHILNCSFENNTADWGGANHFDKALTNTTINGNYTGNTAGTGGANAFYGTLTNTTINGNYNNNTAQLGGANNFQNTLTNTTINGNYTGNTATLEGGANHFDKALTNTTINGNYTGNTAQLGGANNFQNTLTNTTITGNYTGNTAGTGGANRFKDTLTNTTITGNYTGNTAGTGGANYFFEKLTNTTINGNYTGNTAGTGGANYFFEKLTNTIITGNYNNNTATLNGGANRFKDTLTNTTITGIYINNRGPSTVYIAGSDQSNIIRDSIFINNTGNNIEVGQGNIQVKDCWFANNATDYNMTPNAVNIKLDNWLFLNATANPNGISLLQTADITFSLYSYVPDSGVSEYNSSRMLPFELNLTSNGKIDKNTTPLDSAVKYTPKGTGKGITTATFITAIESIEFEITKIDPELKASAGEITYGENATITLSYNSTATGNINITLNGKKHTRSFENMALNTKVTLPADILPDEYDVTVTYSGDGNFRNATAKTTLTVNRLDSNIQVHAYDINVTEASGVMFKVALPENATGTLTLSNGDIINVTKEGVKENGKLIINIKNDAYAVGKYNWTFNYLGDNIYLNSTADATSNILIIKTEIIPANRTVELTYNDTSKVNFTAIPEGISPIAFKSSNSSIVSVDSQGNIVAAGAGSAKITIEFEGNATHAESNATVTVTVKKAESTLDITNVILDYGNTANITAKTEGADGITAKINSQTLNVNNYTIQIPILDAGNYTLTVTTIPDKNHNPTTQKANITVNKIDSTLTVNDTIVDYGNTATVNVTYEGADKITAQLNDKELTIEGNTIQIPILDAGNYTLTVTTIPDKNHNPTTQKANITVNKIDSTLTVNDTVVDYGNTATVNVTYEGADKITAKLNDKELSVKGNTIQIPIIDAGNYTLTVTTIPDKNHNPVTESAEVIVLKQNATQTVAMPENMTVGDNATVNVKLPADAKGNITLTIDGEKITTVPVSDGSANLTIPSLAAGNHTVEITYSGDGNYNPTTEIKEIEVLKDNATADIEIDDNTVTIDLPKDARGNITVKVDGEEISTVPVENGTANVELPEMKAGNHTVEITYSGDDKYNPSAKSVTISIAKKNTELTAEDINATYKVDKYLEITLKDANAVPLANATVTVTLDTTKNYTTDEEGKITIKVSNMTPKTYTAEIIFKGDSEHFGCNTTTKITVKKAAPKITAKAKTFKTTVKTKKYTITLKDNTGKAIKNAKVTLKVKGKTYKATTNSKGKATFKITKLTKKGTYKATITYKGNKYYTKTTQKTKITIKSAWKTVSKGSKDKTTVKKIQRALKNNGYYLHYKGHYLMIDGIYHDCTQRSVKEFQKANHLKQTGKVDEKTAKKLKII